MVEQKIDIVAEKTKAFKARTAQVFEIAREKQKAGEFKLVKEFIAEPNRGYTFDVKRGQSFRFELLEGNQIVDVLFINQHNRDEHYAMYTSSATQGPAPYEGYSFISNSPYFRGMTTIIRDTVSYQRLDEKLGKGGKHMFAFNNARCDEGMLEMTDGTINGASCKSNILDALYKLGGEELLKPFKETQCVCMFQPNRWELNDGIPVMKYYESEGIFRKGDYVEFIAEQDLTVVFSMCPWGGQTNLADPSKNICWPLSVKIFDTGIDVPIVDPFNSTEPVEFIKQGRPNVTKYAVGVSGGEASFEAEAKVTGKIGKAQS